jgi:predicted nucleotide-binding protein
MPPNNASSQPPIRNRTVLAQSLAQVEEQIGDRIRHGRELQPQPKSNLAESAQYVADVQKWRCFNLDLLQNAFTDKWKRDEYYRSSLQSFVDAAEMVVATVGIAGVSASVDKQILTLESILERLSFYEQPATGTNQSEMKDRSRIFIVHGHEDASREAVARFIEALGFQPIILHERPNEGRTVIEKVEAHGDVGFAVVLLTPDDEGCVRGGTPEPRARQNVLLELGYFIGRLGRNRVCALKRGELEIPSDFGGVVYEPFDAAGAWKQKLGRELEAVG